MRTFYGRRERLTYNDWRKLGWDKRRARECAEQEIIEALLYVAEGADERRLAVNRPTSEPPGKAGPTRRDEFAFEWGYNGSGPHETARAILGLILGEEPVPWVSQQFKQDVIAQQPQDGGFAVSEGEVGEWADWTLSTRQPPDAYPQARDQLAELAERGRQTRRKARKK